MEEAPAATGPHASGRRLLLSPLIEAFCLSNEDFAVSLLSGFQVSESRPSKGVGLLTGHVYSDVHEECLV